LKHLENSAQQQVKDRPLLAAFGASKIFILITAIPMQVKYLWLLFDLAVGGENMVEKGPYP
jgi:hypothetical protein